MSLDDLISTGKRQQATCSNLKYRKSHFLRLLLTERSLIGQQSSSTLGIAPEEE
ncbi:unnamed protein product, partial [Nesidiocoris tenuis]